MFQAYLAGSYIDGNYGNPWDNCVFRWNTQGMHSYHSPVGYHLPHVTWAARESYSDFELAVGVEGVGNQRISGEVQS